MGQCRTILLAALTRNGADQFLASDGMMCQVHTISEQPPVAFAALVEK